MAAVTICSNFGARENKICHCLHCFPIYLPGSDGTQCHDLEFFDYGVFSQLFNSPLSSSSKGVLVPLSASRVVLAAYLRLLFLPAILIPVCASSSLAFRMIYSACKLNKQGDNIQSWHTPFPIFNQSGVPRPVLTVASWPAYRFLRRQVRWSSIPISWRISHSLLWSTQSKILVLSMKQK